MYCSWYHLVLINFLLELILMGALTGAPVFPGSQATFDTSCPGKTYSLPIFPLWRGAYLLLLLIVTCAIVLDIVYRE